MSDARLTPSPPHHASDLQIYPRACLGASPTYWKWVKLTVADVHHLRAEPRFQGNGIFFHLNHPIRHVYLCGTIVAVQVFARFLLVTLDDGSGQTIEIKIAMVLRSNTEQGEVTGHGRKTAGSDQQSRVGESEQKSSSHRALTLETIPTTVENVQILQRRVGVIWYETILQISGEQVDVGAVMVAKGTLNRYHGIFQLQLLRTAVVSDLGRELRIWREYADFAHRVLCKPWELSSQQVHQLEGEEHAREAAEQKKQAKVTRRKREAEATASAKAQRVKRDEEMRQDKREREEEELNGNALDKTRVRRSNVRVSNSTRC